LVLLAAFSANAAPAIRVDNDPAPRIHGPRVTGTTPRRPFLFLIPATGDAPLKYAAKPLPAGLQLDPDTGILSGAVEKEGRYAVKLIVSNARGNDTRTLVIVAGSKRLALTPPMGWNPWNIWARDLDDGKVRDAADWMVKSGLAAHGYQYVNLDDCWEGGRNEQGEIQPNKKFPGMKALSDYVHAKGLRFGIYSSPGKKDLRRLRRQLRA
jgi:alpha-galactosidase